DRIELAPSNEFITQLTSDGVLKPIAPNVLKVGDDENYLNDVVTANVTVASLSRFKENIRELDPKLLEAELPTPKMYERTEGRKETEIGFIAEELPEFLRRGNGYDLKALVTFLAWKVKRLEAMVRKLTEKLASQA
ncbi:MAG: tail fiber domain-containing protein, partial [Candidatus Methanospirareceae archaeon]